VNNTNNHIRLNNKQHESVAHDRRQNPIPDIIDDNNVYLFYKKIRFLFFH